MLPRSALLRRAAVVGVTVISAVLVGCTTAPRWSERPIGDAVIRAATGRSEIVITTTARLAGAVHSLRWDGREFIDSVDHGRQLQSASNFDAGITPIRAETFNPTEAGSRLDHVGNTSTSRILRLRTTDRALEGQTQMAFWLAPEEFSLGNPARNRTRLSNHLLARSIEIGTSGLSQAIRYDVVFTVPPGEGHRQAVFESLTGYMPAEFAKFWKFDATSGALEPLTDGPGEQSAPVVLATEDGSHAMGIWSPDAGARYGRFRFVRERVVKWNCVFRPDSGGKEVPAGDYAFRHVVVVGNLDEVRVALRTLTGQRSP